MMYFDYLTPGKLSSEEIAALPSLDRRVYDLRCTGTDLLASYYDKKNSGQMEDAAEYRTDYNEIIDKLVALNAASKYAKI